MALNILLNFIFANIEDESVTLEYVNDHSMIEENCFKAIKFSLEIPVVPIRKILLIFYIYLRLLFG